MYVCMYVNVNTYLFVSAAFCFDWKLKTFLRFLQSYWSKLQVIDWHGKSMSNSIPCKINLILIIKNLFIKIYFACEMFFHWKNVFEEDDYWLYDYVNNIIMNLVGKNRQRQSDSCQLLALFHVIFATIGPYFFNDENRCITINGARFRLITFEFFSQWKYWAWLTCGFKKRIPQIISATYWGPIILNNSLEIRIW